MKRQVVKGYLVILFVLVINICVYAGITSVSINPPQPTTTDFISIITAGVEGSRPVGITPVLTIIENNIVLDLSMEVGILQVVTPWSHTENIGYLPAGIYNLEVNAIYSPTATQTFSTSFEVVPEPTSLLLFATGIVLFRGKCKKS